VTGPLISDTNVDILLNSLAETTLEKGSPDYEQLRFVTLVLPGKKGVRWDNAGQDIKTSRQRDREVPCSQELLT